MLYQNEYTREISFPVGGIGTGSFGVAGNGRFIDWEIFNKPSKGSRLGYTHIMVKAKTSDGTYVRVLQGDLEKDLTGPYEKTRFSGFGYGPSTATMSAMPHFAHCTFNGAYPTATLTVSDDSFPGTVTLTVFNPFIPLDAYNSSLPAGLFRIAFQNPTDEEIEYTAIFSASNPFTDGTNTTGTTEDGIRFLTLSSGLAQDNIAYGDITVAADADASFVQRYWYRGGWNDNLDVFIHELLSGDILTDRVYDTPRPGGDTGSIAVRTRIPARGTDNVRFVLSWNVPNNHNYWSHGDETPWKNYYATVFADSRDSAAYTYRNFDMLHTRTVSFRDALHGSTLDPAVIDAAASTMSVLKSPTVLRLSDGSFYGWEGVHEQEGSCEGTCQHVWNYAYALCFLFPELEKSIRVNEFTCCTAPDGRTAFRMMLPKGSGIGGFRACVDGQMGCVIKTYREWKLSGDNAFLRDNWGTVKQILAYAWSDANPDRWDHDRDGVLEGRQHHTLDMELFGPSAWLEGFYLCALRAAAEMADFLGDTDAKAEYGTLFEKGYTYTKEQLFNGEYFSQNVDLCDKSVLDAFGAADTYWYEEAGEMKYQIGDGCALDQLLAQWHANLLGLGDLFDPEQKKTALANLYKNNFKSSMREFFNTWRVYSLNDEGGSIICTFPKNKPTIPLPYHAETMTGFEYAFAGLLISEGFEEEGLSVVRAIRDRYNGKKRNPWNEIECGSNYARAMASFALLPIFSGFSFDLPHGKLGFSPLHRNSFRCFFSVGTGWGTLEWTDHKVSVILKEGTLDLCAFDIKAEVDALHIDGTPTPCTYDGQTLTFAKQTVTDRLEITLK